MTKEPVEASVDYLMAVFEPLLSSAVDCKARGRLLKDLEDVPHDIECEVTTIVQDFPTYRKNLGVEYSDMDLAVANSHFLQVGSRKEDYDGFMARINSVNIRLAEASQDIAPPIEQVNSADSSPTEISAITSPGRPTRMNHTEDDRAVDPSEVQSQMRQFNPNPDLDNENGFGVNDDTLYQVPEDEPTAPLSSQGSGTELLSADTRETDDTTITTNDTAEEALINAIRGTRLTEDNEEA